MKTPAAVMMMSLVCLGGCAGAVGPAPRRGVVELECRVMEDRLQDCRVLRETPSGAGFGDAALESAARARLTSRSGGAGTTVRFTTRFDETRSGLTPPNP